MKSKPLYVLSILLLIVSGCTSATDITDTTDDSTDLVSPTAVEVGSVDNEFVLAAAEEFLAVRSPSAARGFLQAVHENPADRWVPWVVDLLRAGVSNRVDIEASAQLEFLTGIPAVNRITDLSAYGSWAHNKALTGGEGYLEFKASIYERFDPLFGDLLRSVSDPVDLAAIQWGGAPVGGIPELQDPERVLAAEADFMFDDEIVFGVISNGEAVAYPLRVLARHELANDTIGGDDLSLIYCTLCRSALVYERDVGGQTVNFLTSGLLINSNKIMYDRETGTLWSHLGGVGIGGALTGVELSLRSVQILQWSDWVDEHPGTEVITLPEPIFFDDPERGAISYDYTPGEAYQSYYDDPDLWFPTLDVPDTFPLKTDVVGIQRNGDALAFRLDAFIARGSDLIVEVGGDTLTVQSTGVGARVFDEGGELVFSEQSFWFAWYANNPDTRTLEL